MAIELVDELRSEIDNREAERDRCRLNSSQTLDGDLLHDFDIERRRFEIGDRESDRDWRTDCVGSGQTINGDLLRDFFFEMVE